MIIDHCTRALIVASVCLAVGASENSALSADAAAPAGLHTARPVEEREAVAALERRGVRMTFHDSGHVRFLDANQPGAIPLTDEDMEHVAALEELEFLGLFRTKVTDAGMARIRGMPKLNFLNVPTGCTDAVVPHLETLPSLTMLIFDYDGRLSPAGVERIGRLTKLRGLLLPWGCGLPEDCLASLKGLTDLHSLWFPETLTDDGMAYVRQFPHLKSLLIPKSTRVTDAGMANVVDLRELEDVFLPRRITDAGLRYFGGCQQLRALKLEQTLVTDAGLEVVRSMRNLKYLRVPDTVTDAGLEHLKGLRLEILAHPGTTLTDEDLARLRKAIPSLRIAVERIPRFPLLPLPGEKEPEEDPACVAALRALGADFGFNPNGKVRLVQFIHTGDRFTDKETKLLLGLPYLELVSLQRTVVTDSGMAPLKELSNLEWLLLGSHLSEHCLATVRSLPKLRKLNVFEMQLTAAGLAELNKMTNLEHLTLPWRSGLREDSLLQLKGLTNLRFLDVPPTLSDDGLSYLMQFPNLEALDLRFCKDLTDAGLAALQELKQLETLTLPPGATDAGLRYVSGLTKLKYLDLDVTQATDDGLRELRELQALRTLSLPPGASDAGLDYLKPLKDLSWVTALQGGQVTLAGVQRLAKSLPRCKFTTYQPSPP